MKKQISFLLWLLTLTGCYNKDVPSTVVSKKWDLEEQMDKTVKPGDDFFMYSNGSWFKNAQLVSGSEFSMVGFMMDVHELSLKRRNEVNNPGIKKFCNDVDNLDNTTEAAVKVIKEHLKIVDNITTEDQAHKAIIETMKLGYDNLVSVKAASYENQIKIELQRPKSFTDFNARWAEFCMNELGFSNVQSKIDKAEKLYHKLKIALGDESDYKEPEEILTNRTLSNNNNVLVNKILNSLGVKMEYTLGTSIPSFYSVLESAAPYDVQCLLEVFIASQLKFTSHKNYTQCKAFDFTTITFDKMIYEIKDKEMNYIYNYAFAEQYVSPESKTRIQQICEELRSVFNMRISSLKWMSEATKQQAKEKLDAMIFNVGYPNKWIDNALPTFKGSSLLEHMFELRQRELNLFLAVAGTDSREARFYLATNGVSMCEVSATYHKDKNVVDISMPFIISPYYDPLVSDAVNYATFSIIGHEITHGFDAEGALFDKFGNKKNWWSASDEVVFKEKQQQLINCYNKLEVMPDEHPGVFSNGKGNLKENMADLGGVEIAYQAYMLKLQREGYSGEELNKQQQRFFQAWANLFRSKYDISLTVQDPDHALARERVNGPAMNMDAWHELYNVKPGDKLYVKPEDRVHIW